MADLIILYWRDIPAQVIAERGRGRQREKVKIELPRRFSEAIDASAMIDGAFSTDDYLKDWRRSAPAECGYDLNTEARALAAKLEDEYDIKKIRSLVENGGKIKD
ncbi:virulence factor [Candidatus Puniceispirillum sp.]|nr:virulence factor [Candidatus Puniceispirillum sp.]